MRIVYICVCVRCVLVTESTVMSASLMSGMSAMFLITISFVMIFRKKYICSLDHLYCISVKLIITETTLGTVEEKNTAETSV
jgi:hypothetical protein